MSKSKYRRGLVFETHELHCFRCVKLLLLLWKPRSWF